MFSADMFGLALGLFLALGIFAVKTAVGNYYYLSLPGGWGRKIRFLVLVQLLYALLFCGAFEGLKHLDAFHAADCVSFLKNGILLHLLLCLGLIYWGVRLLLRKEGETLTGVDSKGWLLLTVPCPVCLSAIFLSCAFALMLFPEWRGRLVWLIPLFFLSVHLFFLLVLAGWGKLFRIRPLELTGRMMILTALYFILILLIAPQFQEAGKLYAAAGGGERESGIFTWVHGGIVLFAGGTALCGFLWNCLYEKRS